MQLERETANLDMARSITQLANQNASFSSLVCGELATIRVETRSNTECLKQLTESSKKMQIQLDALQRNQSISQTGIIEGRNLFCDSSHTRKY